MSTIARDVFNREGPLGVNWEEVPEPTQPVPVFTCDGNSASPTGAISPEPGVALFTNTGNQFLNVWEWDRALVVQARITMGQLNDSNVMIAGLIFNVRRLVQHQGGNTAERFSYTEALVTIGDTGSPSITLQNRTRGPIFLGGGALGFVNVSTFLGNVPVDWEEGESRTLRVEHNLLGNDEAYLYVDGQEIGSLSVTTHAQTRNAGLSWFAQDPGAGQEAASLPLFDSFRVEDSAEVTAQLPPTPTPPLTLTPLLVPQEGDQDSGLVLTIMPDAVHDVTIQAATSQEVMAAGYVIRTATNGAPRRTFSMAWSNRFGAEAAELRAIFGEPGGSLTPGTAGGVTFFRMTHPEFGELQLMLAGGRWADRKAGPRAYSLSATLVEIVENPD